MARNLDQTVARFLASRFRHESRRSFLSRATRALFALAGVGLAARVLPFAPGPATASGGASGAADETWAWCGLHGYLCEGGCDPKKNPNSKRAADKPGIGAWWLACCKNPKGKWQCIHYADYCGRRGPDWEKNCKGFKPSGQLWCGIGPDRVPGRYICTKVEKVSAESDDIDTCHKGCTGGINEEGPTS
ncbi:MAG: hypothetical protein HYS12_18790 [Planctomycetes bacterium]|nr:hypothetical protein [Planctomycetota bacterium]